MNRLIISTGKMPFCITWLCDFMHIIQHVLHCVFLQSAKGKKGKRGKKKDKEKMGKKKGKKGKGDEVQWMDTTYHFFLCMLSFFPLCCIQFGDPPCTCMYQHNISI